MNLSYPLRELPVLEESDVVVCGGSLAGVALAVTFARQGRRVVIVEPRTYLGREITATQRPWVRVTNSYTAGAALPEPLARCVAAGNTQPAHGEFPLVMDAVKTSLEDALLEAGVVLIYASLPVAVISDQEHIHVVIGNKSGRQVLSCRLLVDATETAVACRAAGAHFAPAAGQIYTLTLEFTGIGPLPGTSLEVPPDLGVLDNRLLFHAGYRDNGHWLVECPFALPAHTASALDLTQREVTARRRAMQVAAHLLTHVPAFAKAYLATVGYELAGPLTPPLAGGTPSWASTLTGVALQPGQLTLADFAAPQPGVWTLHAARVEASLAAHFAEPAHACTLGAALATQLDQHWDACCAGATADDTPRPAMEPPLTALEIREPPQPQRGRAYPHQAIPPQALPALTTTDVLVVGGGTSGATAAYTAGRAGLRTALVDMNPGLGGTGTYGGIHTYWYGRRVGFSAEVMSMVDAMHDKLGLDRLGGPLPTWNIEAKIQALLDATDQAGVEMILNALVIGAVVEGNHVRGVVVATRWGPVALLAAAVIDASGDGDVAAYAGARYVYGSERDHTVMYTYMAQVAQPGRPRNVKTGMVDVANIVDYTRAILDERRRRKERDHDHGIYMAPRESRHIRADLVMSLTDQLVRRAWPDVINIAFSNNDIKGQSSSDWVMIGLISPNLEIEIPYRALIPNGLENILVVGKAYSATHDALAAPRMQPDLENLGGVGALAAAQAIRNQVPLRAIDVRALQTELVQAGVLPSRVLTRTLMPLAFTDEELAQLAGELDATRPLYDYSDMELNVPFEGRIPLVDLLCAGPQAVPVLEQALATAEGPRQLLLAKALALVGSRAGVPVLIAAAEQALSADQLPVRTARIRHAGFPPDQNAAPDVAFVLHALTAARDARALPLWERIVGLLAGVTQAEVLDRDMAYYYYVVSVCFGAERLGDPAAAPLLRRLHSYPLFRQRVRKTGFEPDWLDERMAYLELVIGRALARCGDPEGFVILINYLDDNRALLTEHAHTELIAITGQDLGKDAAAWGQWLELEGESLGARPWQQPSDPVLAWDEKILIEP